MLGSMTFLQLHLWHFKAINHTWGGGLKPSYAAGADEKAEATLEKSFRGGNGEWLKGCRASLWDDENILKLDCGAGSTTLWTS